MIPKERGRQGMLMACLVGVLLAACGGGGGGSGTTPAVDTSSGLLPAAVTLGATLAADATTLRPLRDKASWVYRGRQSMQGASGSPAFYENIVTQVAQAGGMREDSTNVFNEGSDTGGSPVFVQAGAIKQQLSLPLVPNAPPLAVEVVELRSPVRANDRYVLIDKRIADVGVDVDGDKKNDGLDIAAWVQVGSEEVIDLPNRSAVRTIRTDTTIRARVRLAVDGSTGPVEEERLTVWYAEGLGVVKLRRDSPSPSLATGRIINEEVLVSYDGLTEGLGATTKTLAARSPMSSNLPDVPIPFAYDAVAFDNHIVVISDIAGKYPAAGFMLTQIGSRGEVLASTSYARELPAFGSFPVLPWDNHRLYRVGDELRLLYVNNEGLNMLRFSSTGQTMLSTKPTLLVPPLLGQVPHTVGPSLYRAALSGSSLWVVTTNYVSSSTVDQARLELRRFSTDGVLLGAPQVLESGETAFSLASVSIDASSTHALLTWSRRVPLAGPRHLFADSATGALTPSPDAGALSDFGPCGNAGNPVTRNGANLILCIISQQATALTLGSDGVLLRNADGSIKAQTFVPASWTLNYQGALHMVGDMGRFSFWGDRWGKFWPEDMLDDGYYEFAELPLLNGGLNINAYRSLARVKGALLAPLFAFTLGNRIVVIGTNCRCQGGTTNTMVVWR